MSHWKAGCRESGPSCLGRGRRKRATTRSTSPAAYSTRRGAHGKGRQRTSPGAYPTARPVLRRGERSDAPTYSTAHRSHSSARRRVFKHPMPPASLRLARLHDLEVVFCGHGEQLGHVLGAEGRRGDVGPRRRADLAEHPLHAGRSIQAGIHSTDGACSYRSGRCSCDGAENGR